MAQFQKRKPKQLAVAPPFGFHQDYKRNIHNVNSNSVISQYGK